MSNGQRPWGDNEVARLREAWAIGLSASEVALRLASEGHPKRSRNAVIGRLHRLGLSGRGRNNDHQSTAARIVARRRAQLRPPRPPHLPEAARSPTQDEAIPILGVSLHQLNDMTCRYPVGDPQGADFAYCGRTCHGGPYCVAHTKLCYTTPVNKRQAAATERLANWLDRRTFKQAAA